jgi:hypothetical protein
VSSAKGELVKVNIPDGSSYIVDLQEKECSCSKFQEFLIPYYHTIAVCLSQTEDLYDYIDS